MTRYGIVYGVNRRARVMSLPSNAHTGAAKHALRYHAGTINYQGTYKKGGITLTTFSDANLGNNPDNGKSRETYYIMISNGPVSFKGGSSRNHGAVHHGRTCRSNTSDERGSLLR